MILRRGILRYEKEKKDFWKLRDESCRIWVNLASSWASLLVLINLKVLRMLLKIGIIITLIFTVIVFPPFKEAKTLSEFTESFCYHG